MLVLAFPPVRRWLRAAGRATAAVWRPGAGLLAVVALAGAAVLALEEDWWVAGVLALAGGALALGARRRRPSRPAPAAPAAAMTPADARAILGVADGAAPDVVEAAYRRLIRMAHPDRGGTAGLAAQLNLARATLKPR